MGQMSTEDIGTYKRIPIHVPENASKPRLDEPLLEKTLLADTGDTW